MEFSDTIRKTKNNGSHETNSNSVKPGSETAYDAAIPVPNQPVRIRTTAAANEKGTILIAAVLGTGLGSGQYAPGQIYQGRTTLEIQGLNENLLNTREVNPSATTVNTPASRNSNPNPNIAKRNHCSDASSVSWTQ